MDPNDTEANEPQFHHVLHCPCGMTLQGDTEDELVERSFAHLRERHPDMADHYGREHILFMSLRLRK
jgi:predicted small metal-binding protein